MDLLADGSIPPDYGKDLILVGADVSALFPSMSGEMSGRLVNQYAVNSDLSYKNLNPQELAKYAALCSQPGDWKRCGVQHLIPWRRFKMGPRPGVSGEEASSGKSNVDDGQWIFPDYIPNEMEIKKLFGLALEIGVKASFGLHLKI